MKYSIITISREHGSGGRLIAKKLSEKLGIPMYDKELIELTTKETGISEEHIRDVEKKRNPSFLFNIYLNTQTLPLDDQIYIAQSNVIKELAEKGPCIIVGRCADYVLRDRKDCLRTFVYAPMEERIERMKDVYHESEMAVEKVLNQRDKMRAAYYNYHANSDYHWSEHQNYNLMIDSSMGIDLACMLIVRAYERGECDE